MQIRRADERGHTKLDWLDSAHTFSFGNYYDERFMGFGPLRVINEDRVQGGGGFAPHSHRDMEIVTYVLRGGLNHQDSLGNGSTIQAGDVQRMSAGTGVTHSEYNESDIDVVHFLQIWIEPERHGMPPSYEQCSFDSADGLRLVGSRDGRDGSVTIHRDVEVYLSRLAPGGRIVYEPRAGRRVWVQVTSGGVRLNGQDLAESDGAALDGGSAIEIASAEGAEFLLFDLD